jgi:nanoRNase/pAp phosphatase (c-di-AMP/oligoRNAs hydrolase)
MSLSPTQQFQELIRQSSAPLIILPSYPSRDAVATALALSFFLGNTGKEATLVGDNILSDKKPFTFVGEPTSVIPSITSAREFVLSFDTTRNRITDVRTEQSGNELRIYLTPERGAIDPRDFSFIPARFRFDLAIVIGSPDKESLGKVFEDNPDIFYEIPIVNIDNHSENELFGQINLVDITASSSAEILANALEGAAVGLVDERVSEGLLAGIIAATESFQKKNTTPKALRVASHLMGMGADQQRIVHELYKMQPLHLLKLWGRAMAQAKWDENLKLIWTPISIEDLVQSRSRNEDLPIILEKIRGSYAAASICMIIHPETATTVSGLVKASSHESLASFAERIGNCEWCGDMLRFTIVAANNDEAEHIILEKLTHAS